MKNMMKYIFLVGYLFVMNLLNAQSGGNLSDYQTSWIANNGGTPYSHIPHSMESIFVREDGVVASICGWDEGGTNVGLWKDGKVYSIPFESGTGSWGRNSGKAVVVDDNYVYQLMSFNGNSGDGGISNNVNGLQRFPPKGAEWQLIARFSATTGTQSRFSTGYGPSGSLMLVARQTGRYLEGLAISGNDLIIATPGIPEQNIPDSLKIFDKTTMSLSQTANGGFRITEGGVGYISADKRGFIWMLQPELRRIVAISLTNGGIRPQSTINLPEDVVVKSFSVDTYNNRILVPNSGKDQNVLIYTDIYTAPVQSSTFGVKGGIYVKSPKPDSEGGGQYLQGEVGHMRFPGPTGVGVDGNGNIYISTMFPTTATAILYSYNEETRKENWKLEGLVFTSTADFSLTQENQIYGTDKLYEVDYTKLGGRLDKLIASTHDPFMFPNDFRCFPSPIICGVFNRMIDGKEYQFVTNMYSSILGTYRYDKENYGYIAIPCNEVRAEYIWKDENGDGQKTEDEIKEFPSRINTFSIFPDRDGNIWMTDAVSAPDNIQFKLWRLKGVNAHGVLEYEEPVSYRLPSYIIETGRVVYDAKRDEMLITCYTQTNPNPNSAIWGRAGSTVLTYKNMKEKFANIATIPSYEWEYDQELLIPVALQNDDSSSKSIAFAGDYLFIFLTKNGEINVYNRDSKEYIGQIKPPTQNGWTDITYALNARKNADGTYELLCEENGFAKIVHHYIRNLNPTAIREVKTGNLIVSPNPATTTIHVNLDVEDRECLASIISIDGSKVMQQKIRAGNSIDVSGLPRGYYILEVVGLSEVFTQKIILK